MYDYFYGQQAELFSFYRVPKVLFTDEKFSNISSDAKLLYGIMLDRMNLSAKTDGWMNLVGSTSYSRLKKLKAHLDVQRKSSKALA